MNPLRPVALVTGASSGIGEALVHVFSRHGHELALVARREDRLRALAAEIAATGAPKPLVIAADLGKPDAAQNIAAAMAAHGVEPQFVVNNAGFGLIGEAAALDRREQLAMIDVNVRALTELSLTFIESLVRHRGGLLNVASIAGFMPGPRMAVYYASKAYVLSLTEALHVEFKPHGVRVCALCPGPVPTEFAARSGLPPSFAGSFLKVSAEDVAAAGYRGLMRGRRMVVPGALNKIGTVLAGVLPRGLVLAVINRVQAGRARGRL